METFEINDVIDGQYKITKVLGRGGMGIVLAASRPGLSSLVAIKVLLPEVRDKADVAARFAREARAADTLRSEHVARVLSVGTTPAGTPFMVMEHLTGTDLAGFLKARGRLDVAEAANLLLQPCEAIAEAHTHGIIHRDLKPGNLFVTTNVDGPFVKVLDFGIAKVSVPDDVVSTDTSAFFGSPLYMSPEQLACSTNVDARADVWALGIILYELLAGAPPFKGDTVPLVYAAIVHGKYEPLSTLRPNIAPELDALIAEALALKPESRLASVEAFAKKLARFGGDGAKRSYERIARIASGATQPEVPSGQPDVASLRETAAPRSSSLAPLSSTDRVASELPASKTENETPKTEAPQPAKSAGVRRLPALLGVAGVAIAGTVFGLRQVHGVAPAATASSSAPASAAVPSASAAMAPVPSASAEPRTVASSAPSAPAPVVLADPVATPAAPSPKTANECVKGATKACEAACAAHAPGRCEALARALVKGTGAPKDVARAQKLFQTECDNGAGSACNSLGILYANGNDVTKDSLKAVGFYKLGCDHEDRVACTNLGSMHFGGTGVPKNEALGVTYYLRACPSTGPVEPLSCVNLSIAYGQGRGAPKDPSQALAYAKQACDKGAPRGCTLASIAKLTGDGVPKDVPGALSELDGLCARGEPSACAKLIGVFSDGLGADVAADPARARATAEKGCKAHDAKSCQVQSLLQKQDNLSTSLAQNIAQLETSCTTGVLRDCGFLGETLLADGIPADRPRGLALLDKACKGGVTRSCQKLAEAQP